MDPAAPEARLAAALVDELRRSAPFAAWFFERALPAAHPLTQELARLRPELARAGASPDAALIEVMFRHAEPDWTLLLVLAHHAETPLTAAHAGAARARAAGAVAAGECKGACVLLLCPRRVARDNANTDSFHRVVTYEAIGEHLASPSPDAPDDPRRAAIGREFLAAAVRQARGVAAAAEERSRGYWESYDQVLRPFAAHLQVLRREAEPGSDVRFAPGPAPESAVKFELVHHIRAARAALHVAAPGADPAALAARLATELPADLYLQQETRGVMVWQRVPPLRADAAPASQANDLRHAFLLLWRLKNWRRATLHRWGEWLGDGVATPAPTSRPDHNTRAGGR